jgi:aryl-alcohol dehydrogenase-like predicted oxidoreductase
MSINNHTDYIRQAVEASLTRIGLDILGFYYMYRRDPPPNSPTPSAR